jgi:hypothetical protein
MRTLGVTSFPRALVELPSERDPIADHDFKSSSFHTDFVMNALLGLIDERHSSLFEAIASLLVTEANFAVEFLDKIITSFVKRVAVAQGQKLDDLFAQLEIIANYSAHIVSSSPVSSLPFFCRLLDRHRHCASPVSCRIVARPSLFRQVQSFYQRSIQQMTQCSDRVSQESLFTFLSDAIISQNQPLDLFVGQCENILREKISSE